MTVGREVKMICRIKDYYVSPRMRNPGKNYSVVTSLNIDKNKNEESVLRIR
jgi:hypothetical protein